MTKQEIIKLLDLKPHIEGGYFCRTYESRLCAVTGSQGEKRHLLSSIFYMLTQDSPIGYLHLNQSDIIHYYHSGSAIKYVLLHPDGKIEKKILGAKLEEGQSLQVIVKGGCWKASELVGGEFGLLSEAVAPGFDYNDMVLADDAVIRKKYPDGYHSVARYIKPNLT